MRTLPEAACGIRELHARQQRQRARARLAAVNGMMPPQHLHQLPADRQVRRERGHRVLEHHADRRAAQAIERRGGLAEQLLAGKAHAAGGETAGAEQPHDGEKHLGLARAGFAEHAEALAAAHAERDAGGRHHPPAARVKADAEPGEAQQRRLCTLALSARVDRGHRAARPRAGSGR